MSSRLPALTPRKVIAALKRAGFFVKRTSGSHYLLQHTEDPTRKTIVPYHNKDLKTRTLRSIIRQAGVTVEEFVKYL